MNVRMNVPCQLITGLFRRQETLFIVLLASTLPQPSLMPTTHTVYSSASTRSTSLSALSLDLALPAGAMSANETSPLLPSKHTPRRTIFAWWKSFFDDNLGLLLVAASQFFFSGMNVSVKWLNSSDEPVPTLEVCVLNGKPDPGLIILSILRS